MARKSRYGPYNYERTLGNRNYNMEATVSAFVETSVSRMRAVAMQSTQDLINIAQTPVGKGGKMRVDTGFLRASGQLSLTGLPTGPSIGEKRKPGDPPGKVIYPTKPVAIAALANFQIGMTIYFGWTANYAKYREAYDGFLISALQNWQSIVDENCKKLQTRIEARRKP